MSELFKKQTIFTKLLTELIVFAYSKGYQITLGEAWRPDITAQAYAKQGKGIKNSLHSKRLAIDLNLFKDGKYLDKSEDHRFLGEFWESLGKKNKIDACWGGRFKRPDGNHYSIAHEGVK